MLDLRCWGILVICRGSGAPKGRLLVIAAFRQWPMFCTSGHATGEARKGRGEGTATNGSERSE